MKRLVCLSVLALMLAGVVTAGASTFIALSRQELVSQSDAVIQGRVLKVESYWGRGGRIIMSEVLVQVEEKIRGNAPTVVRVRTFGGTVGGYTVEAHGFPKLAVNERVVLFLTNANETAEVTGYRQGQWRVVEDKGVLMAVPTVEHGVTLLGRDGRQAPAAKAMRLDTFKNLIRAEGVERPGRAAN